MIAMSAQSSERKQGARRVGNLPAAHQTGGTRNETIEAAQIVLPDSARPILTVMATTFLCDTMSTVADRDSPGHDQHANLCEFPRCA
jgi:hypothetical protein